MPVANAIGIAAYRRRTRQSLHCTLVDTARTSHKTVVIGPPTIPHFSGWCRQLCRSDRERYRHGCWFAPRFPPWARWGPVRDANFSWQMVETCTRTLSWSPSCTRAGNHSLTSPTC